jgi:hypothetical protein
MAAVAVPLIEAAVTRILIALGVGMAADAARREIARKRSEEADQAKSTPLAKTAAKAKEKCDTCPLGNGAPYIRNFTMLRPWIEYQARICGLPFGPNFITEWMYNGKVFDGLKAERCALIDAKGAYDQFFDEQGKPKAYWEHNIEAMTWTIKGEDFAARPAPPVNLEWFWQEPVSYRFFSVALQEIAPRVVHHYQP